MSGRRSVSTRTAVNRSGASDATRAFVAPPPVAGPPGPGPGQGRFPAGALFGDILRRFHLLSYAAGGLLLGTLVLRRILGPAPRRFAWRAGLATVMLGAAAYSGIAVSGRIGQLQREIGVAPSSLPEGDARRAEFGRLHGLSTALQLVPVLGGLMLMYWEIKE